MALPASEPFTGTGALSASWTNLQVSCSRDTDRGKGDSTTTYCSAYWSADAFNNDQKSQATAITNGGAGTHYAAVGVRMSSGPNWYAQFWDGGDNDLLKNVAGTVTQIAGNIITTVAANDVIRLEVEGTSLRVYLNNVQQGVTQTDSSLASGSAGIAFFDNGSRIDDWEGDNLGGAPADPEGRLVYGKLVGRGLLGGVLT